MKKMLVLLAALPAAALAAAPPKAPPPATGEEASIPLVRFDGIWDFEAVGDDVVYLQDRHHNWYRAQLDGRCPGLPFAFRLGVDTRGSPNFDRASMLIVDRRRCPI